jgi:hypothetical protein
MQLIFKSFIVLGLFCTNFIKSDSCNDNCQPKTTNNCSDSNSNVFGKTFFAYRPQDSNVAKRMVGVIDNTNQYENNETYGTVSASVQYTQTRNSKKLAQFFSFTGKNPMSYGPTCGEFDIYGINFGTTSTNGAAFTNTGLGSANNASGGICLSPQIQNTIFDIDLYTNWSECLWGLNIWTRANLPLVNTRWNLHLKDTCNIQEGSATFATHLVSTEDTEPPVPTPNDLSHAFAGGAFGQVPELNFGTVNKVQDKTALAGFHFEVGYDFIRGEDAGLSAGIHMVAPTGNTPEAKYLFEPIAGANHAWQLGGTVNARYNLWQSSCSNKNIGIYFDSVITHLFASTQRRLFGLTINGKPSPGSSYLILKKYTKNNASDYAVSGLQRAANLLACETKIKVDVMTDLALMLQYNSDCFMSGIGWNFWYRSREELECETACKIRCCPFSHNERYAIKGDALANDNDSQSTATIGTCATADASPVYLTDNDIDRSIALNPSAYSNKVFGFIGRNWNESPYWTPYVLLYGEVEFGHNNTAADQWGIMLKGGVSF